MNNSSNLPFEVDIIAQLGDLKEVDYKNTLILTALIDLLVERKWITRSEVMQRAHQLDQEYPLYSKYDDSFPSA
ncbi:MAG: hypothetical protein JWN30_569 [Bacilli bacterium]|nr:hypothetical protein [Bacilli bacterium]